MRRLMTVGLGLLVLGIVLPGCETYTERVGCSMGQVLDDDDNCVPPPPPDGGASVATCSELCVALTGFDDTQLGCIETNLSAFGPTPAACMTDLRMEAECTACVAALGLDDPTCATAGSVCQQ